PSALVADRQPRTIADLAASLEDTDFQTLVYRTRDGHDVCSRLCLSVTLTVVNSCFVDLHRVHGQSLAP
ncbi:MAG: hypothetical protein ACR2H2_11230, partial [Solirubrobacteraceae bacterium]